MTNFKDLERQVNDILGNYDMNNSKNSAIVILVASIVLSFIITYLIARRLNKILFLIINVFLFLIIFKLLNFVSLKIF